MVMKIFMQTSCCSDLRVVIIGKRNVHRDYEITVIPMQFAYFLKEKEKKRKISGNKNIFLVFAKNIDCGHTMSTHSLCFGAKYEK